MRRLMVTVACIITIAGQSYTYATEVTGKSSFEQLTDVLTIRLPRPVDLPDADVRAAIPVGAPVTVQLGWPEVAMVTEFVGYVATVMADDPITIQCEDHMWPLKQISRTGLYPGGPLAPWLKTFLPQGITLVCPDVELAPYRFTRMTIASVLRGICSRVGLYPFFRLRYPDAARLQTPTPELIIGLPYSLGDRRQYSLDLNLDVPSQNLEYRLGSDYRFRVTAVNYLPSGSVQELVIGDADGADRTLTYRNHPTAQLESAAKRDFARMKYDGYRGTIEAFGLPPIRPGDVLALTNSLRPERTGEFLVDTIEWRWGQGYFRQITLGPSVASAADFTAPTA
jgi:hypothetical protein